MSKKSALKEQRRSEKAKSSKQREKEVQQVQDELAGKTKDLPPVEKKGRELTPLAKAVAECDAAGLKITRQTLNTRGQKLGWVEDGQVNWEEFHKWLAMAAAPMPEGYGTPKQAAEQSGYQELRIYEFVKAGKVEAKHWPDERAWIVKLNTVPNKAESAAAREALRKEKEKERLERGEKKAVEAQAKKELAAEKKAKRLAALEEAKKVKKDVEKNLHSKKHKREEGEGKKRPRRKPDYEDVEDNLE